MMPARQQVILIQRTTRRSREHLRRAVIKASLDAIYHLSIELDNLAQATWRLPTIKTSAAKRLRRSGAARVGARRWRCWRRPKPTISRAAFGLVGDDVEFAEPRPVETGLVMLRGRIGGDGAPFNVGEATVTRAAVRLAVGRTSALPMCSAATEEGARRAALCDALWQADDYRRADRAACAGAAAPRSAGTPHLCAGANGGDARRLLHSGAWGGRA